MLPNLGAAVVVLGSLVNALPSATALYPIHAVCDLNESDVSGSGREICNGEVLAAASAPGGSGEGGGAAPDGSSNAARDWRAMAARCRNLARWQNEESRAVLLRLAEEYDARAVRAERSADQT
jgi:hypothetical protein